MKHKTTEEWRDLFGQAAVNNRIDLDTACGLLREVIASPLGDHIQDTRRRVKDFLEGNSVTCLFCGELLFPGHYSFVCKKRGE